MHGHAFVDTLVRSTDSLVPIARRGWTLGLLCDNQLMDLEPKPLSDAPVPIPDEIDPDVIVLPREIQGDRGLYHDSTITLAKELRRRGITADYQHPPELRTWIGEKAFLPDVVSFFIGIASSAGWDGIVAVLRVRPPARQMKARVVRYSTDASGTRRELYELEGSGKDVIAALETLRDRDNGQIEAPPDEPPE